jgi:putative membrane protein
MMAKTLILNIDRDDDFGRKALVKSPIIGIQNNLDAANKLGLVMLKIQI